ncbi:polysaccharide biosynthesis protein [Sulfuricella sp. T08]|uniref:oligosaccharide flippase family protein n=1 Tax=Sulfuricella sp. T08 TaxID=1632857 RepID=UPI0006179B19|nr:oligosaccharide flippase family protein [Sulfuricella sp. T08]GAO34788.1 polysaccharide biosynthesis protein [Sulfuricella sp. T08]
MSLKKNVLANYLGQGWSALMGLAFVPLYIKYLGMEAYGLIGVFAILQAWLSLLDMGMTPTLSREMARYTAGAHTAQSIRDLLRSLEVICLAIAMLIVIVVWLSATWFSVNWLQAEKLPVEEVAQAIAIIGFVVALRFVESLYRGAILGLQKQVWLSAVGSGLATLRGGGAVCVLVWVKPSIEAFFIWQGLVSVITILAFVFAVYRYLPPSVQAAKFSWLQLKNIWRFAGGMMATTLLVLLLMQVDKIILSRMLSLEMFGYYTLAGTAAAVLSLLTIPITQAYYPRFTELVAKGDTGGLIKIYHQSAQLISVLIVPAALILVFFGEKILLLWTGNAVLADKTAPLLVLLALGMMLNSLMGIPYMLTLAYGWPGFAVRQNFVAVIILIPAILWATPRYGAIGAAWIWVILNAGYVLIAAHYLYRRLLKSEKWHWYLYDVVYPTLGALIMAIIFWLIWPHSMSELTEWIWLLVVGCAMVFSASFSAPILRNRLLKRLG